MSRILPNSQTVGITKWFFTAPRVPVRCMARTSAGQPLLLSVPQWQGEATYSNCQSIYEGGQRVAAVMRRVLGEHFPWQTIDVPAPPSEDQHAALEGQGMVKHAEALSQIAGDTTASLQQNNPTMLITAGGDCAVELASVRQLHRTYGDELLVMYIDAHADLNTAEESPSGHFHGMVLRALLGDCPPELSTSQPPLRPDQVVFVGVRELDLAEAT